MKQIVKKAQHMAFAAGLVFSMAMGITTTASAAPVSAPFTTGAKVTFTFDDGLQSHRTLAAPVLEKYGFPGVAYVTTGCAGMTTTPNTCPADGTHPYMSWDQITELQNTYGWEIGSHTVSHPQLATDRQNGVITAAQMAEEITGSKTALNSNGFAALNFADPFGDYDTTSVAEIAKHYTSHRGFHDIANNVFPYNEYLLTVQQIQGNVSLDTVKGYIDQAKAGNQWLILVFHEITEGPASTNLNDYQYSAADLEEIAKYVQAQSVPVTDIAHGLANSSANLFASSPENGLGTDPLTQWTTDSPANVIADSGNHGAYPNPANSISLTGGAGNAHLFSPRVTVNPAESYVVKSYLHVAAFGASATVDSEVGYLIDEYDAAGNPLGSKYFPGLRYSTDANPLYAKNVNFVYTPSATAATARMQVVVTANSGIQAYIDNFQMFPVSAIGSTTPPAKVGDIDGSGIVDNDDATILFANWGNAPQVGDLDKNGVVDNDDATILFANWSK